ncbi:Mitochondrial matrix protein frataxin, involved in Fe/S protein biosynthesis [Handroanthus impetiginosus]|uniref:ferroxidase n=1 Tax=Handroanthus impetiginosus TaxID=429701 RepID=A0A2G9GGJ2_9LAMI|nr:Mitochondrial matrix protein frataxin, involved in Fe/S protein biosynthesis [Handroanthus impetiginosus]
MATHSLRRTLLRVLKPLSSSSSVLETQSSVQFCFSNFSPEPSTSASSPPFGRPNFSCRSICSRRLSSLSEEPHGPAAIDYRSLLQEDEYHRLANSIIHHLLEKLEEYGDSVEIDGYDVDYGNEVLTLKLGSLGTYVINKQTPNRQIWMSSPVSGPSRFDWDHDAQAWIYRRTKGNLIKVLESELEKLCGEPISLS